MPGTIRSSRPANAAADSSSGAIAAAISLAPAGHFTYGTSFQPPRLRAAGLMMSVFGGMLLGELFAGVNYEEYLRHVPLIVSPVSILSGLVKCGTFAVVLATICTYQGYSTTGGAKGVGRAVVATAVTTMICIVVMDWMTSFIGDIILTMVRGFRP